MREEQAQFTACFLLVSCLAYSSSPKMEVVDFSETSVNFYQITLRHVPKDSTLQHGKCLKTASCGGTWYQWCSLVAWLFGSCRDVWTASYWVRKKTRASPHSDLKHRYHEFEYSLRPQWRHLAPDWPIKKERDLRWWWILLSFGM
jgi:hypothetical protein